MFGNRLVILLIVTLTTPLLFSLGPLRLSPFRLVLLATFLPLLFAFFSGRAGKTLAVDWLLIFAAFWSVMTLIIHHGFALGVESGGIYVAELLGGYFLGRICIRDAEAFRRMTTTLFLVVLLLLPFAAVEALTDRALLLRFFEAIGRSYSNNDMGMRMGLHRAQVVFEHPILYGVFSASCIGVAYYAWHHSFPRRMFAYVAVTAATIFSVSTGALAAIVIQTVFIGWEMVLKPIKARWRLFAALVVMAYISVDILSNRSPFHVFVHYMTFSSGSSYNRILIFEHGSAEVMRHPFFGIGLNDWTRPRWMSASVDNFWLLNCMRYGLPMGSALMIAVFLVIRGVSKRTFQNREVWISQAGYLTSMGGLILAGATVHFWNSLLVWFMFFLGSGVWMVTHRETAASFESETSAAPTQRYRSIGREQANGRPAAARASQ